MNPSDSDDARSRPIVFSPVSGPTAPDMDQARGDGIKRHEQELARAERLTAQARAGSAPDSASLPPRERRTVERGAYLVEFDWRGETATYFEHERWVSLSCAYWGGPTGSVAHTFGIWEYPLGRREPLTVAERQAVLLRVVECASAMHDIALEISNE